MAWEGPADVKINNPPTQPRNDGTWFTNHALLKKQTRPAGCAMVSRKAQGTASDISITVVWNVPWSQYLNFIQWLCGYSYVQQVAGVWKIRRVLPDCDPVFFDCYCSRWSLIGGGAVVPNTTAYHRDAQGFYLKADGTPANNLGERVLLDALDYADNLGDHHSDGIAQIEAEYTPAPDFQYRTDDEIDAKFGGKEVNRLISLKATYAVTAVPISRLLSDEKLGLLNFAETDGIVTAGTQIPEAGIKLMPTAQYTITQLFTPDVNTTAIDACRGKVNATAIAGIPGLPDCAPETLLYQSSTWERKRGQNFRPTHSVQHTFCYRPLKSFTGKYVGWNVFPTSSGTGLLGTITPKGEPSVNGTRVFQSVDFYPLFEPSQGPGMVYQ